MEHLVLIGKHTGRAAKDDAFIFGREQRWLERHMAHHAQRDCRMQGQGLQLVTLRSRVDIECIGAIPDEVDRDAIGSAVGINHRQHSIFGGLQDLTRPLLIEQAVLAPHGVVDIVHDAPFPLSVVSSLTVNSTASPSWWALNLSQALCKR